MSSTVQPFELGNGESEIVHDTTPREVVAMLCEVNFVNRLFDPLTDPFASEQLREQREVWRQSGDTVVFTQGVFDLFHLNHGALLQYSRISAVPFHYDRYEAGRMGVTWHELSEQQKLEFTVHALSSGAIKQVVSIDGTQHVAARKNGDPTKPGARPFLDWGTRARDVLQVSAAVDGITPRFLVDAVTVHDKIRSELKETPHATIMDIARFVDPDVWAIHADSPQILSALKEDPSGRYSRIQPVVLPNRGPYSDELAGEISTSSLVARIGSTTLARA